MYNCVYKQHVYGIVQINNKSAHQCKKQQINNSTKNNNNVQQ